ncbi:hypothetical protein BG90_3847 [Burkholderia oklahomensis C6786]|nr:hypothetical protein BG90_3847 [Burkholderia oklahomensis C6786]
MRSKYAVGAARRPPAGNRRGMWSRSGADSDARASRLWAAGRGQQGQRARAAGTGGRHGRQARAAGTGGRHGRRAARGRERRRPAAAEHARRQRLLQ